MGSGGGARTRARTFDPHTGPAQGVPILDRVKDMRQTLHLGVTVAGKGQRVTDAELLQGEDFRIPAGARAADRHVLLHPLDRKRARNLHLRRIDAKAMGVQ